MMLMQAAIVHGSRWAAADLPCALRHARRIRPATSAQLRCVAGRCGHSSGLLLHQLVQQVGIVGC